MNYQFQTYLPPNMMSVAPEEPVDFDGELSANGKLTLAPIFDGPTFQKAVQFPIIVEMWDKLRPNGRRLCGRIGRAFEKQFTKAERRKIGGWYNRFYRWYLVTGTPSKIVVRLDTLTLLQRAVLFFATI